MSDESIKPPITSKKILNPSLDCFCTKIKVKFSGDYLKQEKITFIHRKTVNIYVVYEIDDYHPTTSYPTLENCLFDAVELTKQVDVDQYKYSGYGIGFNRKGFYSIGDEIGKNVIIFGVNLGSSSHIDDKKKYILNLN